MSSSLSKPDSIMGTGARAAADTNNAKVPGNIGTLVDELGHVVVHAALRRSFSEMALPRMIGPDTFAYGSPAGDPDFVRAARDLLYIDEVDHVATIPTTGGQSGIVYILEYLSQAMRDREGFGLFKDDDPLFFIAEETYPYWLNNLDTRFPKNIKNYKHVRKHGTTAKFNINGFENLNCPSGFRPVFIIQAAGHNITGIDPSRDEIDRMASAILKMGGIAVVDAAYQAYGGRKGEGVDLKRDVQIISALRKKGIPTFVIQSFSKITTGYDLRSGALHYINSDENEVEQAQARFVNLSANSIIACSVLSQQVVANIFNDPDIFEQLTRDDLPRANHLLHDRREILETELENGASERVGFFECFGQRQNLQERSVNDWVEELAKASIYALPGSGRFSVAGVTGLQCSIAANAWKLLFYDHHGADLRQTLQQEGWEDGWKRLQKRDQTT